MSATRKSTTLKDWTATLGLKDCDVEVYKSRDEWLGARRTGIGGSDAPIIAGVSTWKSPVALYTEKLGMTEPDADEKEFLFWGLELQDDIGGRYAQVTGRKLVDLGPHTIVRSKEHPWMIASLDFLEDPDGIVETKCAAGYKADEWLEEAPLAYQCQWQWQAAVTGRTRGAIAVLLGGNKFRYVEMTRNEGFIETITEQAAEFWERVQKNSPPPLDGSDSTKELIRRLYPRETPGAVIPLPAEAEQWDARRLDLDEQIKALIAEKNEIDNRLRDAVGSAEAGILPSGIRYRCKTIERAGYEVKPTSYRELRRMVK